MWARVPKPFRMGTVPPRELASPVGPEPEGTCRGEVLSCRPPGVCMFGDTACGLQCVVPCELVSRPCKGGPSAAPLAQVACKHSHHSSVLARRVPVVASPTPWSALSASRSKGAASFVARVLEHRQHRYPLIAPVRAGHCSATLTGAPLRKLALPE